MDHQGALALSGTALFLRAQAKSPCPRETPVTLPTVVSVTSSSCHCSPDFQPHLLHLDPLLWALPILLDWLMLLVYNALALLSQKLGPHMSI